MSMNKEHIALVQESMEKVIPIADTAADIFYETLFSLDPEVKKLFKSDMSEQKKKLMSSLVMVVKGLSNIKSIMPAVQKLARKHVDYGVKPEHYTLVGNALLMTLQKGLGDDFTPAVREAWIEAFKILATTMKDAAYQSEN